MNVSAIETGAERDPASVPASLAPNWATPLSELFHRLGSGPLGLEHDEAARRLASSGALSRVQRGVSLFRVLLEQFESPLLLLLVFAASVSALTRAWLDAGLVFAIVILSVGVGARREYKGQTAAAALAARVRTRATVLRGGAPRRIPADEVVPGDIVLLAAGSLVPADAIVVEATDCHVNEAVLTGESFSVEKAPGVILGRTPLARRTNSVFQGSNVQSGTAFRVINLFSPEHFFNAFAKSNRIC